MFKNGRPNGFTMTFANGNTISVQWHIHAYCDRRTLRGSVTDVLDPNGSPNAEVAAWDKDDNWYYLGEHDTVRGWVTADEVAELIGLVSTSTDFVDKQES